MLDNPVYFALCTGDAPFARGTASVKYFDEEVSPFAGFAEDTSNGFELLYDLLPEGRRMLYATRKPIEEPAGWQTMAAVPGLQFVYRTDQAGFEVKEPPVALSYEHVDQMLALTALTKPGPFGQRTIDFGHYHGVFDGERLVAMTGQRLHVGDYTEISAVCTHPDYLGRGYAAQLLRHQIQLIISQGRQPFLHVRADNDRAIALYERLGFYQNGAMNFYFLKKLPR